MSGETEDAVQVDLIYPYDVQDVELDDLPDSYLGELAAGAKEWLFQKGVLRRSETGFKVQVPEGTESIRYENRYTWNRSGRERLIDEGEDAVDELESIPLDDGDHHVLGVDVKKNGTNTVTVAALDEDGAVIGEHGYNLRLDERGYR